MFVRLTGCLAALPVLRHHLCLSWRGLRESDAILSRVREFGTPSCVTGASRSRSKVRGAAHAAVRCGLRVSLETSGAMALETLIRGSSRSDVKTPGPGEPRNRYGELARLNRHDLVKFVICSRADYEWSRERLGALGLAGRVHGALLPEPRAAARARTADWILADRLPVRFQIQLHKYLVGQRAGR